MKHIDRLIIKAKNTVKLYDERLVNSFIEFDGNKYIVDCRVWNGKKGSGTRSIINKCDTLEDAEIIINDIADKYPNDKDIIIFIDDGLE